MRERVVRPRRGLCALKRIKHRGRCARVPCWLLAPGPGPGWSARRRRPYGADGDGGRGRGRRSRQFSYSIVWATHTRCGREYIGSRDCISGACASCGVVSLSTLETAIYIFNRIYTQSRESAMGRSLMTHRHSMTMSTHGSLRRRRRRSRHCLGPCRCCSPPSLPLPQVAAEAMASSTMSMQADVYARACAHVRMSAISSTITCTAASHRLNPTKPRTNPTNFDQFRLNPIKLAEKNRLKKIIYDAALYVPAVIQRVVGFNSGLK